MPRAAGLAEQLKEKFGVQSELVESSGGVFEVEIDGKLLFSKKRLGRFPDDGEIESLVKGVKGRA
jgi:selenoprotein W-related protein